MVTGTAERPRIGQDDLLLSGDGRHAYRHRQGDRSGDKSEADHSPIARIRRQGHKRAARGATNGAVEEAAALALVGTEVTITDMGPGLSAGIAGRNHPHGGAAYTITPPLSFGRRERR
jgi:hypothetical protein